MTATPDRLAAALADRYAIQRELGAGGMATVYLAHDLKHDRQVAIKVLRPELAAVIGAERFLSEIKTTANLQHPHILPLFDSGVADGFLFYVMPYVEGESLRDRLTHEKQLPVADAVRLASEVAAALDYAHRHGVIHRDIKPENVMLHDGAALVADFGIALAASKAGGDRMTETGMSLGTPTYMSPRAGDGRAGDHRPLRCLRAGLHDLRDADRRTALHRPDRPGHRRQGDDRRARQRSPASGRASRPTSRRRCSRRWRRPRPTASAARRSSPRPSATPATRRRRATAAMPAAGQAGWQERPARARLPLILAGLAGLALGVVAVTTLRRPPPALVTRYGLSLPVSQVPEPGADGRSLA